MKIYFITLFTEHGYTVLNIQNIHIVQPVALLTTREFDIIIFYTQT